MKKVILYRIDYVYKIYYVMIMVLYNWGGEKFGEKSRQKEIIYFFCNNIKVIFIERFNIQNQVLWE